MLPRLTLAFISKKYDHPTTICYNKFGTKYWDDDPGNLSKIGGYFGFYYKKEEVRIHKIINVLKPSERPADMDWESDRNILCLGPQLKVIKWEEWINDIGRGAPYSNDYHVSRTTCWTQIELDKKFTTFNYKNFVNFVEDTLYEHYLTLQQENDSLQEIKEMDTKIDELQKAMDILSFEQNKIKKERLRLINKI